MRGVFCKTWTFPPQNEKKLMLELFFNFTYLGGGVRTPQLTPCLDLRACTIYDTRRYFNLRSKSDTSRHSLPHGTNN